MRRPTMLRDHGNFDIIMLGHTAVGKTSLLKCDVDDPLHEGGDVKATVGVDFVVKRVTLSNAYIKLNIYDASGQERFKGLLKTYYMKCTGAIVVFDVQNRESYKNAKNWVANLREEVSETMIILMVGNKVDLVENRMVSTIEAEQFAIKNKHLYMESSTKYPMQAKEIFNYIALALYKQKCATTSPQEQTDVDSDEVKSSICCIFGATGATVQNPPK